MMSNKMDRGTDACKAHLSSCTQLDIRQTRKGWLQELLGCEANTEFKYFTADKTEIAHSKEDTDWFCRIFCSPIHPFTMTVKETGTDAELLSIDRPLACQSGGCKCCCYQSASVSSGGQALGSILETFYCCVPTFKIQDETGKDLYLMHPPTCMGGLCVNCCTEGKSLYGGCCKAPFWIFEAGQAKTDGGDAPHLCKIVKKPKSLKTTLLTDADAFDVTFPESATTDQKALLVGASVFLNAVFFEGPE